MLTSKQRSKLKSLAANQEPIGQVGKDGIGENMLKSFSDCLDARELIKVHILDSVEESPRAVGEKLAEALNAECVIVIGRKAVLYRRSPRQNFNHIQF